MRETTWDWIKMIQGDDNPVKKLTDEWQAGGSNDIDV